MQPVLGGEKLGSDYNAGQSHWDPYSEQPYPIRLQLSLAQRLRGRFWSFVKSAFCSLAAFPVIAVIQGALSLGYRPKNWKQRSDSWKDFMGIGVALQSCDGPSLAHEIEKLGVRQVLLRFPLWEMNRLEEHWELVDSLPDCEFVLCLMQDRQHILDHDLWRKNLNAIVSRFWPRIRSYQIGQGINRSKWGILSCDEFLAFASVAEEIRSEYPGIDFVGPSVLDFEPIPFIRSVIHGFGIYWDVVGCSLYVDRRGCPRNRQLLIFDLKQKIYHFVACVMCANRANRRFWITEVNWPLENQSPYAPTSEKECVSEEDAGKYLRRYYEDAWESGLTERVYWWQLVSKGFGLIDVNDDGTLRYRSSYDEFKKLLSGESAESTPLARDGKATAGGGE